MGKGEGTMTKGQENQTAKQVTIVIPNYNGLSFLKPCLEALKKQKYQNFDVLVVDNGSKDGSVQWLKKEGIPAVFLEENTGFSGAVNVGIRKAATPYVLLLNNDTEAEPEMVGELVRSISRSERIFAVSAKLIQLENKKLMDDAGDMYSVMGWAYQRGVGHSVKGYNKEREVFSACAAAAIYRRGVFERIGYFDEKHFAYLEDIDVCYRAKIFGYHNRYCPSAVAYHVGSATSGSKYNEFKVKLAARNNIYLNYKNMPWPQLLANALPLLAGMLVKYVFFKNLGFEKAYAEGVKEGLATMKSCRRVAFRREHAGNYLSIQWELMEGTALYVYEFAIRQLRKMFP